MGGPQRGQQQSATQTLRVHLLGIDLTLFYVNFQSLFQRRTKSTRKRNTPENAGNRPFPESAFSGVFQKNSRRLELSISKNTPRTEGGDKVSAVSRPKVPGRFAFPGARNPRICSISRVPGKFFQQFSPNFPGVFLENSPEQTPETATAFSSFRECVAFSGALCSPASLF